jgi:hypothetical protein
MTRSRGAIPELAASSAARWATHSDPVVARLARSSVVRVTDLLGEAHRLVSARELADVLLGVRASLGPLHAGEPAPAPSDPLDDLDSLTPATGVYLRTVQFALAERTRTAHPDARRRLASVIEDLVDDLAALPRGAGVLEGAPVRA